MRRASCGSKAGERALKFDYYKDPEKTKARRTTREGWSTVGDMGYVDDEGYLYLTDRRDFMIVSGGVNIYPQEAENLLITHPKVMDAAVFGVPNEEMGEEVKGVVQPIDLADAGPELEAELIAFCREQPVALQVPGVDRLRRRAPAPAHRQALQAAPPRPLLGRQEVPHRLTLRYSPRKCGARFSAKAAGPSWPSSVPAAWAISSVSKRRCWSSVCSRLPCIRRFAPPNASVGPDRELRGECLGLGIEIVVGHHARDQSPLQRFGGAEHPIREHELERPPLADEARQEPARRPVGREADPGVRHHELGRLGRDHQIRRRRRSPSPRRPRCPAPRRSPARRAAPAATPRRGAAW